MRLTDQNGTRTFSESPERTVRLKKKFTKFALIVQYGCIYETRISRFAADTFIDGRILRTSRARSQLTFALRNEN